MEEAMLARLVAIIGGVTIVLTAVAVMAWDTLSRIIGSIHGGTR